MKHNLFISFLLILNVQGFTQSVHPVVDSLVHEIKIKYGIPSLTATLITEDDTYFGIDGSRKIGSEEPVSLNAKFHLGSNTKAVTSFMAFKLIEEGKLSLSTKLLDMYPEWKGNIRSEYVDITLGDLLSHNARLQPFTSGAEFKKLPEFTGTLEERRYAYAKHVLNMKPVKDKGTYSNAGYNIAALLIGKAAGSTYEDYLDQTMKNLNLDYFIGFPNKQDTMFPWGHWMEHKHLVALPPDHSYKLDDYSLPAGDLSMTVIDYAKFIQLHLKGLDKTNNYLTAESYTQMHFALPGYSYGWGNSLNGDDRISFHDGSAGTYYCHTVILPANKLAVVVMANAAEDNHVEGMYQLRDQIIQNKNAIIGQ